MTVKELITNLLDYPHDATVYLLTDAVLDYGFHDVISVDAMSVETVVIGVDQDDFKALIKEADHD